MSRSGRIGAANSLYLMVFGSIAIVAVLGFVLFGGFDKDDETVDELVVYCAAGMRYPMEEIKADYEREFGVRIQLNYGGSNTLLSQLEVNRSGDLFLAADDSYIQQARDKKLAAESIPLAEMNPVIVVRKGNELGVTGIDDLLRPELVVALGDPEAAAIGKTTRNLLSASKHWPDLHQNVTKNGVFKETVNAIANDVKLGSADAGIVWDSTVAQYPELEAISVKQLAGAPSNIEIAVLKSSKNPTAALRFARYVGARDKGLQAFRKKRFTTVEGDVWEERPHLTFFYGTVNRKALEPIIKEFAAREGVEVTAVPGGCGVLTTQMRSLESENGKGFPDVYMACDVYYLNTVRDLFLEGTHVSDTDIVIVVQEGNPKNIARLSDLTLPGVRVALGQPDQCTIGVLSRRLLQKENLYDQLFENDNIVTQTQTSALLVPAITSKSADAVLAYRTDTLAEEDKLDVVEIDSPLAKAIQPFSIAQSSQHKQLGQRLFDTIARSRSKFEQAGFNWRLNGQTTAALPSNPPETSSDRPTPDEAASPAAP